MKLWGSEFAQPQGWIAVPGEDEYAHEFGGDSWVVRSGREVRTKPALLLNLDLNDPKLAALGGKLGNRLPLCSFVNSSAWWGTQQYRIFPEVSEALFVLYDDEVEVLDEEDQFPVPFQSRRLILRDMEDLDYPTDETNWNEAVERFLGGDSVIRLLGPPLWVHSAESETCDCGKPMQYIAAIGQEMFSEHGLYIAGHPLYLGESAMYFFYCSACLIVRVKAQPT